jgi:hypothetical protein
LFKKPGFNINYTPMITHLENEHIKVAIDTKGAQLSSFINKVTGIEHMWQADEKIWPWACP